MSLIGKMKPTSCKGIVQHVLQEDTPKSVSLRDLSPPPGLSHRLEFSPSVSTAACSDEGLVELSAASSNVPSPPPGLSQEHGFLVKPAQLPLTALSSPPGLPGARLALPCLATLPDFPSLDHPRPPPGLARIVREVWSWNFDEEWNSFLAVASNVGPNATIAVDAKFLQLVDQDACGGQQNRQYEFLRDKLGVLQATQIGFAVAAQNGSIFGAWQFNIQTEQNACAGISSEMLGKRFESSKIFDLQENVPLWVSFSGFYVVGHLMSMILQTRYPLPQSPEVYTAAFSNLLPARCELRDYLPWCSLDGLVDIHQVERSGVAQTAGSDALAILELYFRVVANHDEGNINAAKGNTNATFEHPMVSVEPPPQKENWATFARSVRVKASAPWRCAHVPDGQKTEMEQRDKKRAELPKPQQRLPAGSVWASSATSKIAVKTLVGS